MNLFVLLAAIVIMIVGFITIGVMNTILVSAAGAGLYWYITKRTSQPSIV